VERARQCVRVEAFHRMNAHVEILPGGGLRLDLLQEISDECVGAGRQDEIELDAPLFQDRVDAFTQMAETARRSEDDITRPLLHAAAVVEHPVHRRTRYASLAGDVRQSRSQIETSPWND